MKFLILLIIVLILTWKFWPQDGADSAKDSFMGPQMQALEKARAVEDDYIDAVEEKKRRIDEQTDGG